MRKANNYIASYAYRYVLIFYLTHELLIEPINPDYEEFVISNCYEL